MKRQTLLILVLACLVGHLGLQAQTTTKQKAVQLLLGQWKLTAIDGPSTALLEPAVGLKVYYDKQHSLTLVFERQNGNETYTETYGKAVLTLYKQTDTSKGYIRAVKQDGQKLGKPVQFYFRELSDEKSFVIEAFNAHYRAQPATQQSDGAKVPAAKLSTAEKVQGKATLLKLEKTRQRVSKSAPPVKNVQK